MEKEFKEDRCQEKERQKKKYEDYIADRSSRSRAAAAISRRPPYHLIYIRQAKAGCLPWQKNRTAGDCAKEKYLKRAASEKENIREEKNLIKNQGGKP